MARRRDPELFDLDADYATAAIEHWGSHVIGDAPDPECELCASRSVWTAQQAQRGGAGQA